MKNDIMHYYIGEGPQAENIITKVKTKWEEVRTARESLKKEYGADSLFTYGWNGRVEGLCFKERQEKPFLRWVGRIDADYDAYRPNLKHAAGKALKKKLADPAVTFNFSTFITQMLGVEYSVAGQDTKSPSGVSLYYSVAGIVGNKILVKIPSINNEEINTIDKMPCVPEWLREVKESEWLAAQGK